MPRAQRVTRKRQGDLACSENSDQHIFGFRLLFGLPLALCWDISFRLGLVFCCLGKVFLIEKRIERLKDQGLVFFFFGLGIGVGLNFHDSRFPFSQL
jgi:hypothetical protein